MHGVGPSFQAAPFGAPAAAASVCATPDWLRSTHTDGDGGAVNHSNGNGTHAFTTMQQQQQPTMNGFNALLGAPPSMPVSTPFTFHSTFSQSTPLTSSSSSASSFSSSSNPAPSHMRMKRPRDDDAAFIDVDDDSLPPLKKLHAEALLNDQPQHRSSSASYDIEDDPMITPMHSTSIPSNIEPPVLDLSPADSDDADSPVDGEIDTDQWNLSRLKLEVSDQFQPLLHKLSSDRAKRAAGFDPSLLREIQRELDRSKRKCITVGGVGKASWDKSATTYYPDEDDLYTCTSLKSPPQQLILYQKPASHSLPAGASIGLSPDSPIEHIRSTPIITEVDDDEPVSPLSASSYRSASSTSASFRAPSATPNSTALPSSPHLPTATRGEKRRRQSDSDIEPTGTIRIEEVREDDHLSKKMRTDDDIDMEMDEAKQMNSTHMPLPPSQFHPSATAASSSSPYTFDSSPVSFSKLGLSSSFCPSSISSHGSDSSVHGSASSWFSVRPTANHTIPNPTPTMHTHMHQAQPTTITWQDTQHTATTGTHMMW